MAGQVGAESTRATIHEIRKDLNEREKQLSRVGCATCLNTRNHLMKEVEQKSKKQRGLVIKQ